MKRFSKNKALLSGAFVAVILTAGTQTAYAMPSYGFGAAGSDGAAVHIDMGGNSTNNAAPVYIDSGGADNQDVVYMDISVLGAVQQNDAQNGERIGTLTIPSGKRIGVFSGESMESMGKPGMEREAFLEYLQSIFNNGLTLEHLVLVRRKNISGVTVVAAYRVEVTDWNPKQEYINFEIVSSYCAKCYYLRLVASDVLDSGGGIEPDAGEFQQKRTEPEIPPRTEETAENTVSEPFENADVHSAAVVPAAKDAINSAVKQKRKKERTDILEKVNRLKEDIQNKTC